MTKKPAASPSAMKGGALDVSQNEDEAFDAEKASASSKRKMSALEKRIEALESVNATRLKRHGHVE